MVVHHLGNHEENGANHHDGCHPWRMQVVCGHLEVLGYHAKGLNLPKQLSTLSIETDVEALPIFHIGPVNCDPGYSLDNGSYAHTMGMMLILTHVFCVVSLLLGLKKREITLAH